MIAVERFNAKLVAEPQVRHGRRGPVCAMRIRQVDPGRAPLFIDLVAFDKELVASCVGLRNGTVVEVPRASLIYSEWEGEAKQGGKPHKRSKHSLIAEELEVVGFQS